jgi:hypothetical protein
VALRRTPFILPRFSSNHSSSSSNCQVALAHQVTLELTLSGPLLAQHVSNRGSAAEHSRVWREDPGHAAEGGGGGAQM